MVYYFRNLFLWKGFTKRYNKLKGPKTGFIHGLVTISLQYKIKNYIFHYRPSMSQGTVMIQAQSRQLEKDFTVATPEEFIRRFGGTKVINKVK